MPQPSQSTLPAAKTASAPSTPARTLLIAAWVLALVIIWGRPGPPLLRGSDAAVYAQIGAEMAAQPLAMWADMTLEDAPFYEHPPGMMVLLAATFRVFGATAQTCVNVAHVLMTLLLVAVAGVGRRLAGVTGAAGSVLGACLLSGFYAESQNPMLELPLALGLTVGVWGLLAGADHQATRSVRSMAHAAAALGPTWAFWAKGPPALLCLPVAATLAYVQGARCRGWHVARALASAGALTAATVALFGAWRSALELPPFFATYARVQLWPSIAQGRHHPEPSWFYYLPLMWRWYAPAVLIAPLAGWMAQRARRPGATALLSLATVWIACVLLGFSAMQQKYQWYLHAALPGLMWLWGAALAALPQRLQERAVSALGMAASVAAAVLVAMACFYPTVLQPPTQPLHDLQALAYPDGAPAQSVRRIAMCTGPWGWRERYVARFARHATLVTCDAQAEIKLTQAGWQP